jgi:hypothetical protein
MVDNSFGDNEGEADKRYVEDIKHLNVPLSKDGMPCASGALRPCATNVCGCGRWVGVLRER